MTNKGELFEKLFTKELQNEGRLQLLHDGKPYTFNVKQVIEGGQGGKGKADFAVTIDTEQVLNISLKGKTANKNSVINRQNRKNLLNNVLPKLTEYRLLEDLDSFMQSEKSRAPLLDIVEYGEALELLEYYLFDGTGKGESFWKPDMVVFFEPGQSPYTCYDRINCEDILPCLIAEKRSGRYKTDQSKEWNGKVLHVRIDNSKL